MNLFAQIRKVDEAKRLVFGRIAEEAVDKADEIMDYASSKPHFVAWSDLTKDDFTEDYWNTLWGWYHKDGHRHVAAWLASHDISRFDPKAPPPKTEAFWSIVDAGRAPEDAELADVLDKIGNPDAVTISRIANAAVGDPRMDLARALILLQVTRHIFGPGLPPAQRTALRRFRAAALRGYREAGGSAEEMAPFLAAAWLATARDLAPNLDRPEHWLRPEHLAFMRARGAAWKRRARL